MCGQHHGVGNPPVNYGECCEGFKCIHPTGVLGPAGKCEIAGYYKDLRVLQGIFDLYTCQNISVYNLLDYFKLDLQKKEICLKEEGIPDVCLSFFKTGTGHETCNRWMEANRAKIKRSEAKLKKCVQPSTSQL